MIVNIEKAEEIVHSVKNKINQKRLLQELIQQVEKKRKEIKEYIFTVKIIDKQYQKKRKSLEKYIDQLEDRDQSLNEGILRIEIQQQEITRYQNYIEKELQSTRLIEQVYREKKKKREQEYCFMSSLPIISTQTKKRYIKARNKYSTIEQQVSESRQALEKCKNHLKLISKNVLNQSTEKDELNNQKIGSINTIKTCLKQLNYLKKGCDFWSDFDSYQAQVVLESAIYLSEINSHTQSKKNPTFDINQVWEKTFKLACFEYGDSELYGDSKWDINNLQINFDCELCRSSFHGWPKVIHQSDLACEVCFNTIPKDYIPNSISIITPSHSKKKRLFNSLFNIHSKINPI